MKDVHIIAKGKGWDNAPETGETWGVNDIILRRDQLSVSFHMHDMEWIKRKEEGSLKLIIAKAEKENIPIMTTKKVKWIPTSESYPLDEVINRFKSNYFGSSIDYMVALALYRDYDEINLYGVNMVLKKEYERQRGWARQLKLMMGRMVLP